jgi:hypothetical protein
VKDVINIVNLLLKDLDRDTSLESLIYAVRDLVSLSESNEYLQVCINELSKAKKQDQKHFENLSLAVIEDVHHATAELRDKIDCYPRLKKAIGSSFFKETKTKFDEQLLADKPRVVWEPFLKLLKAILDCGEAEHLITPYASIASNNGNQFIKELTFSDRIKTFCRDAEHFRTRRDMALWNAWDRIILFHEWEKNGIPQSAPRDKLEVFSANNQIKRALKAICRHLLTTLVKFPFTEGSSRKTDSSEILLEKRPETFIIKALELFIEPFECQIWILSHHNNGDYHPYFVAWRKDGSRAHEFAMNLLSLNRGDVLVDDDLAARRNDLGIKGILKDIFFQNSNVFNGRYVRVDELPFKISNEQLFADLPKTKQRIPNFPIDAYKKHRKSHT